MHVLHTWKFIIINNIDSFTLGILSLEVNESNFFNYNLIDLTRFGFNSELIPVFQSFWVLKCLRRIMWNLHVVR